MSLDNSQIDIEEKNSDASSDGNDSVENVRKINGESPHPVERFRHAMMTRANEDEDTLKVAIVMHDGPDPDCIGGGLALQRIIKSFEISTEIKMIYRGEVSHPLNKTMVNILDIRLTPYNVIENEEFDVYISVDCVPARTPYPDKKFMLAVDHHKNDTKDTLIADIRPVGSVCSILWEYLEEEGIVLDKMVDDDEVVATAMAVGIKIDTSDFVSDNVTDLDFEAYKSLLSTVNVRHMSSIVNFPIPPYHFELRKMLDQDGNVIIENGVFVGGIGYISRGKRDALPVIAEERARQEGIDTAVIFAIVGDEIHVCVRSNALSIDVNALCQTIFGKHRAGGKQGAGAAKLEMGFCNVDTENESIQFKMWDAVRAIVMSRVLKEISNHR